MQNADRPEGDDAVAGESSAKRHKGPLVGGEEVRAATEHEKPWPRLSLTQGSLLFAALDACEQKLTMRNAGLQFEIDRNIETIMMIKHVRQLRCEMNGNTNHTWIPKGTKEFPSWAEQGGAEYTCVVCGAFGAEQRTEPITTETGWSSFKPPAPLRDRIINTILSANNNLETLLDRLAEVPPVDGQEALISLRGRLDEFLKETKRKETERQRTGGEVEGAMAGGTSVKD